MNILSNKNRTFASVVKFNLDSYSLSEVGYNFNLLYNSGFANCVLQDHLGGKKKTEWTGS